MSETLNNNFIPQYLKDQNCLNDELQESNKKPKYINDANKSYLM